MMPLYQHLELGLDIGPFGIRFKSEHVQGPALCIEDFAALGSRPRLPVAADADEQVERILRRKTGRTGGTPGITASAATLLRLPPTDPIFQVGRWPVRSSFWYLIMASSLMPAKKL